MSSPIAGLQNTSAIRSTKLHKYIATTAKSLVCTLTRLLPWHLGWRCVHERWQRQQQRLGRKGEEEKSEEERWRWSFVDSKWSCKVNGEVVTEQNPVDDTKADVDDDNWLFCKRMYLKLKNFRGSQLKECSKSRWNLSWLKWTTAMLKLKVRRSLQCSIQGMADHKPLHCHTTAMEQVRPHGRVRQWRCVWTHYRQMQLWDEKWHTNVVSEKFVTVQLALIESQWHRTCLAVNAILVICFSSYCYVSTNLSSITGSQWRKLYSSSVGTTSSKPSRYVFHRQYDPQFLGHKSALIVYL